MDNSISATYIRPTQSLNHVMVAFQSNIFSTGKKFAYVKNSDFFKSYTKGQEFNLPPNPIETHRFHENGERYEYSDGTPHIYLAW